MNHSRKDPVRDSDDDDQVQEGRRRLLRSAAAAAPLIATLPSGAAFAFASASQCINQGRVESQSPGFPSWLTGPSDGFARVAGFQYTFRQGAFRPPRNVTVFSIGATPNSTYYFGESGAVAGNTYTIGAVFDPTTFAGGNWNVTDAGATPVQLLKLYRAESDTGDPYNNPTCANDCTPAATDPTSECVFPLSQIGPPDPPGQNPGNNTGLATSCLMSVNPDFNGQSCPQ